MAARARSHDDEFLGDEPDEEALELDDDEVPSWYQGNQFVSKWRFPRKRLNQDRMEFKVGTMKPGQARRLDRFLMDRFMGYSRSFLQKLIKDGQVLVDGQKVKSSRHIRAGEQITIILPEGIVHEPEDIPFEVIYEDEFMLALVKPSGLVMHPARGNKSGTLLNGLLGYYRARREADPSAHIGIVHRLDEPTSGVLVVALEKKAHKGLTRQFENRLLKKTYLAVVHGAPAWKSKEIDEPIGLSRTNRTAMGVRGLEARPASTTFVCLARTPGNEYALLRAHPRTGRTHQIRVHAAHLGHPLVGDELYGGRADDPSFGELPIRVSLHAETLNLDHPTSAVPMLLRAPLPPDLAALAAKLGLEIGDLAEGEAEHHTETRVTTGAEPQ